mgnify:CR=1 FL=1
MINSEVKNLVDTVANLLYKSYEAGDTARNILPEMKDALSWDPKNQKTIVKSYAEVLVEIKWLSEEFGGLALTSRCLHAVTKKIDKNLWEIGGADKKRLQQDICSLGIEARSKAPALEKKSAELCREMQRIEDEKKSFSETAPMSWTVAEKLTNDTESLINGTHLLIEGLTEVNSVVNAILKVLSTGQKSDFC